MTLSQTHKERFGKNHVLLHEVFNLLSTSSFVNAGDIKLATSHIEYMRMHFNMS